MSHSALGIAETIQSASIKRHPSPRHDINPSTAASEKVPYELVADPDHDPSEVDTASIATDIIDRPALRPIPRRRDLPPLPDLRFEQSYLASIRDAETWQRVAWITTRDQILLPLIQGTVWTLALSGWRFWNRNAQLQGNTLGTRLRRWWYTVNNWPIPPAHGESKEQIVERAQEFYTAQFTSD